MKLIYVVEDHDVIRSGVAQYLELSGYEVEGFGNLADENKAIKAKLPDLIIQDVMLPDGDGFVYIKNFKAENPAVPVIFMTAKVDESDRIMGFELGADDYITKPFSPKELVLRVQAIFRRMEITASGGDGSPRSFYRFKSNEDEMRIDNTKHELFINNNEITLTAAEWRMVSYLAQNAGSLVSRSQILEKCFDYTFESYERVVDTHIKNIRAKLKPGSWIETIRGYGYKFSGKAVV